MSVRTTTTLNEKLRGEDSPSIGVKLIVTICFFLAIAMTGFGIALKIGPYAIDLTAADRSNFIAACPSRDSDACLHYDPASTCGHPFYVKSLFIAALFLIFTAWVLLKFHRKENRISKILYVTAGLLIGTCPAAMIRSPGMVLLSLFSALLIIVTALTASPFIARRIASQIRRIIRTDVQSREEKERSHDIEALLHIAGFILAGGVVYAADLGDALAAMFRG